LATGTTTSKLRRSSPRAFPCLIFAVCFAAILAFHAPLLRLPFFWDEAGYYVPAAHDIAFLHLAIPKTTIDAGHPPLSAAYLALWFSLLGWKPLVARIAMLLMAALALTNVFLLAKRIANSGVAVASTIATAAFPIFFVQSSLTHADLTATALSLWGIRLGIERRIWLSQLILSLSVLCKETAIITPLALAAWELFVSPENTGIRQKIRQTAIRLIPAVPLAGWLLYHHALTGRYLGNADFYAYNVTYAMNPLRMVLAFGIRIWHLLGFMNMIVLTAATLVAMKFPPIRDNGTERGRIAIPIQLQFALVMLAHVVVLSIVGGALLTRYMLTAYPLVIIIGMSTLRRRIRHWELAASAVVLFFGVALFVAPPYKIAPEDNLRYKNFVDLHVQAAQFIKEHEPGLSVLTAWPATDELSKPYLGYVSRPLPIVSVKDFTAEEIFRARQMTGQFQVAYLFSTKYNQPTLFQSKIWQHLTQRYFDDHTDIPPDVAADLLGGRIVFLARKNAEWAAVVEIEAERHTASVRKPR